MNIDEIKEVISDHSKGLKGRDEGQRADLHEADIHEADIHVQNDYALRCTSETGHLDIVKFLIENGVDLHGSR